MVHTADNEASVIAAQSAATRQRPTRHDPAVRAVVAAELAAEVAEWAEEDGVPQRYVEAIAAALRYYSDGYELAKELERSPLYLSPDAALVEILGNHSSWKAEDDAVRAWVAEHHISSPFAEGQMVSTRQGVGEVRKIDAERAVLWVHTPEQAATSNWIINYEDATAADGAQ